MGSAYMRFSKQRWYIQFKDASGKWRKASTDFFGPKQERLALKLLARVESKIAAGIAAGEAEGPVTVRHYVESTWEPRRRLLELADIDNDIARLNNHVLPVIGDLLVQDIRPRHIIAVIDAVRAKRRAPKTVRNVYSVMRAMFRDAHIGDMIDSNPCVLTRYQLGELADKVQGWRATAKLERSELETLISDSRIDWDRRVMYALEGIGALRHGEAAGVRWIDYDVNLKPLGRITVARSYGRAHTKTGRTRYTPVHMTLAAILAEWKLKGWPEMMGRQPQPEDLIVPTPKGLRTKLGAMRTKNYSRRRWETDLKTLGFRHRRPHDLRRTMISLARTDGARKDLLELCTHTPRRDAAIDDYTTFEWPTLCAEIAKLRIRRLAPEPSEAMVSYHALTTCGSEAPETQCSEWWRRRESNSSLRLASNPYVCSRSLRFKAFLIQGRLDWFRHRGADFDLCRPSSWRHRGDGLGDGVRPVPDAAVVLVNRI